MTEEVLLLKTLLAQVDARLRHLGEQLTGLAAGQGLLSNRLNDLQLAVRGVRTAAKRLVA